MQAQYRLDDPATDFLNPTNITVSIEDGRPVITYDFQGQQKPSRVVVNRVGETKKPGPFPPPQLSTDEAVELEKFKKELMNDSNKARGVSHKERINAALAQFNIHHK